MRKHYNAKFDANPIVEKYTFLWIIVDGMIESI